MEETVSVTSNHITPGMIINLEGEVYRVESSVKVTMARGVPFVKTKLKNLINDQVVEKSFKQNQSVTEVKLNERELEYLYLEDKKHLFFDISGLEQVLVTQEIMGDKDSYLKEGIIVNAHFYGETIFSVELPQFLELLVVKTEDLDASNPMSASNKRAVLETGARMEVPMFIESGDIIKVDTENEEYVQRI
ncbi:MAG: Elongation factor P [Chlamydiia bacterium]|nr:Elongation factor P [Chlamydiia bacterium]MCH9624801.1 Elongation factor P [Chlamydiia bacterium]